MEFEHFDMMIECAWEQAFIREEFALQRIFFETFWFRNHSNDPSFAHSKKIKSFRYLKIFFFVFFFFFSVHFLQPLSTRARDFVRSFTLVDDFGLLCPEGINDAFPVRTFPPFEDEARAELAFCLVLVALRLNGREEFVDGLGTGFHAERFQILLVPELVQLDEEKGSENIFGNDALADHADERELHSCPHVTDAADEINERKLICKRRRGYVQSGRQGKGHVIHPFPYMSGDGKQIPQVLN
jgi:hypothetical protein